MKKPVYSRVDIENFIAEKEKTDVIKIQLGGAESPVPGFLVMDDSVLPSVDISNSPTSIMALSYLPENSVTLMMAGRVVEKIERKLFMDWMDQVWVALKNGGQLLISTPYGGSSGFWADPKNVNGCIPHTFYHFDPEHPSGLWNKYKPFPWEIKTMAYQVDGNIEVLMIKRPQA